jgi:hypothetical protein
MNTFEYAYIVFSILVEESIVFVSENKFLLS